MITKLKKKFTEIKTKMGYGPKKDYFYYLVTLEVGKGINSDTFRDIPIKLYNRIDEPKILDMAIETLDLYAQAKARIWKSLITYHRKDPWEVEGFE